MLHHMLNDMDMHYGPLKVDGTNNRILLPNGMHLEYPGLSESDYGLVYFNYENADRLACGKIPDMGKAKKIYGGLLAENLTQALARIVIGEQLLTVSKRNRVVTTTHDELVALALIRMAKQTLDFMLDVMRTPPAWAPDLPLNAEGGSAREYSK